MPKVKSSHLRKINYDADAEELDIEFFDDSKYKYLDVDESEVEAILKNKSKGKAFWALIREEKTTIQTRKGKRPSPKH